MSTLCLLICLAGSAGAQEVGLVIEGYAPGERELVEGETYPVRATGGRLWGLHITYRPGSDVEDTKSFVSPPDGVAEWTPAHAGLARLEAWITPAGGGETVAHEQMVSVRFGSTLTTGLFVMLVAGLILFGGAFVSIRALLRGQKE